MNNISLHNMKCIDINIVHDDHLIGVLRKHDEIIEQLGPSGIKAVAFNTVYDESGNKLDILDRFMWNTQKFLNIIRAYNKTAIVFKRSYRIDQWYASTGGKPRRNVNSVVLPKWLVISKKGINKTKLKLSEIYFYDHLSVMISNKVSFDKYMDNSIVEKATHIEKLNKIVRPEILTEVLAGLRAGAT